MGKQFKGVGLCLLLLVALTGCTIVSTAQEAEREQSEAFDAASYVDGIWESRVVPAVVDNAHELPEVLDAIGQDLDAAAAQYAVSMSGAHNFRVRGSGVVTSVDTESRNGTALVKLDGYDGPMQVLLQIGPLIRGDAIRDGVGFISFGDFREQTQFGQVSRELNQQVADEVVAGLDPALLVGKPLSFQGVFTIRTTNQSTIDLSEVVITPVIFETGE